MKTKKPKLDMDMVCLRMAIEKQLTEKKRKTTLKKWVKED